MRTTVYGDHSVLFATESTLKEQPAVARSVVGALQKANDFIEKNRPESVAILAKEYGLDASEMEGIIDVNKYTLRLDDQLAADFDKLAEFLYANKRITNLVRIRDVIDASILQSVKPELVNLM